MPAFVYFLIGNTIVHTCFPRYITYLCLLYVTVGDPIAAVFGITFKSPEIRSGKTLIGTLSGAIACGFVSFLFSYYGYQH